MLHGAHNGRVIQHRSLPGTPQQQHTTKIQNGHTSFHSTQQRSGTSHPNALQNHQFQLPGVHRQLEFNNHSEPKDMRGGAQSENSAAMHTTIKQMQATIEERGRQTITLQAQLKMATEKAQMDMMMQKSESERKISSLVEKLRGQRMGLEMAKEGLAEMNTELMDVQSLCFELSHAIAYSESRCSSSFTSQRACEQSQGLGDTGGEASSQGSRRSAAGTVCEGGEIESSKLHSANTRIRKLEVELAVSQERSQRIAGLEDEMEMYTSMQDEKILEMQVQIRDLHFKLEAERQRNEELAHQHLHHHSHIYSSLAVEKANSHSLGDSLHGIGVSQSSDCTRLPGHDLGHSQEREEIAAVSPIQLTHRYLPYHSSETWQRETERERDGVTSPEVARQSISELASKFESRPGGAVAGASSNNGTMHVGLSSECEITSSPRPQILPPSATGRGSAGPKPLIQKAMSLYDSRGKPQQSPYASQGRKQHQQQPEVSPHSVRSSQCPQAKSMNPLIYSSPASQQGLYFSAGRTSSLNVYHNSASSPRDTERTGAARTASCTSDSFHSIAVSSSLAGDATVTPALMVPATTLDMLLSEYTQSGGQQEESNPTYTPSNSQMDYHQLSWSSGKMSQMKAHVSTNATSSPSATTSPVPRVLQVQGSKHSSVSSLHRQLMFHGHGQAVAGLPYAEFKQRVLGAKKPCSPTQPCSATPSVRGLQA